MKSDTPTSRAPDVTQSGSTGLSAAKQEG